MSGSALFITVFLARLVEAVEALTIILAAGTMCLALGYHGLADRRARAGGGDRSTGPCDIGDTGEWPAALRRWAAVDLRASRAAQGNLAGQRLQGSS